MLMYKPAGRTATVLISLPEPRYMALVARQ